MKEFIKDVLIALVIVVVITLIIKPTIVKESSMESTLYENNYLFVNKLAYLTADHPDYGDIIVFKSHIQRDDGKGDKLLIKRVIGCLLYTSQHFLHDVSSIIPFIPHSGKLYFSPVYSPILLFPACILCTSD